MENDKYEPQKRYKKKTVRTVYIDLNANTDVDILQHLETVDSKAGYIKSLIRADMQRNQ